VTPTTVITRFEVLAGTIAKAKEEAPSKKFNYADKKGNKECRSYLNTLRTYNGRIDDAHKEAKADILEQGRQIDAVKNALKSQVAALIQPHKDALDAIAKKEAERVVGHLKVIDKIKEAARVPFGSPSQQIAEIHREIGALDLSDMEEFEVEAKAAWADTVQALTAALARAVADEEAAAELARLREEAQIQAERDAEAKRVKDAEEAAAEVARKAQEAADAAALLVIEEAEQRVAAAQAETAAATRRALDAEAVADALQGEALLAIKPAEPPVITISDQVAEATSAVVQGLTWYHGAPEAVAAPATVDAPALRRAEVTRRNDMAIELSNALAGKTRAQVVETLLDGTFHPAVCIDWSKA